MTHRRSYRRLPQTHLSCPQSKQALLTKKDIRSFIGLVGYLELMLRHSEIALPLSILIHDLLRSWASENARPQGGRGNRGCRPGNKYGITFSIKIKSSSAIEYAHIHPLSHYLCIQALKLVSI